MYDSHCVLRSEFFLNCSYIYRDCNKAWKTYNTNTYTNMLSNITHTHALAARSLLCVCVCVSSGLNDSPRWQWGTLGETRTGHGVWFGLSTVCYTLVLGPLFPLEGDAISSCHRGNRWLPWQWPDTLRLAHVLREGLQETQILSCKIEWCWIKS